MAFAKIKNFFVNVKRNAVVVAANADFDFVADFLNCDIIHYAALSRLAGQA
jgi:hypothetical protein